jgi:mono/diheme cytochrome c family protein
MKSKDLARALIVLFFSPLLWLAVAPPTQQAQKAPTAANFEQSVKPFLAENCVACHNAKRSSGSLDLEQFKTAADIAEHRETWEHVVQKLQTGEMPPKGAPRPAEAEIKAVIGWLEKEFARLDRLVKPDPGRVTARRLNRAEYNNTVRDLLGVKFRPADDFPQDDSGYGFDNIGDVLSLSPVLMEKYLAAAEQVARAAVFGPALLKPTMVQLRPGGRPIKSSTTPLSDYDLTGLSLPNAVHATHRFPVEAEYRIRVLLGGVRPLGSEPLPLCLWIDGKEVEVKPFDPDGVASFSVDRQDFGSMAQDFRVRVPAGEHWLAVSILRMYEGLPASYNGPNPSKRPQPPPPEFKPPRNLPPERIAEFRKRFEERSKEPVPINEARASYLEVSGPYNQAKGPAAESLKLIYTCGHLNGQHQPSCERKIVSSLARRAYRRPITTQEVDRLLGLVAMAKQRGDSFEEGLVQALQAMLVSPHFLFRIEQERAARATAENIQPINQHELASRLSYFLWNSMPDDELLRLADQQKLRQPTILATQVRRMLKDPRAATLVENFGGQWLELRKLEAQKPDRQRFPEFDSYLRMSMQRETELFFENLIREDRSILDFIDADYTYINERLARFYGIPGVTGPTFQKVALTGNTQRGGILTQASVLTVSSYATRTSPVLRGKWILENILNAPQPPPPPGVANLDEAKVGSAASLRQQLEEHRKNTTCAACHARLDPLGFGLENFDAIGAWRTQDGKFPIDSTGTLPDGRTFNGPQELKKILRADRAAFAEGLTDKLLTYALGRGLERYDKPTVKQIASRAAINDYRFSSLALEIVKSLPFQNRRGERAQ